MVRFSKGYILVEVLLGLVITSVALVALAQIATRAVSNSGISQKSSDVKLVAERTMEWVKEYKKRNPWSNLAGYALSGYTFCVSITDTTFSGPWSQKSGTRCDMTADYSPEVRLISTGSQIEAQVTVISSENVDLGTISTIFYRY